MSTIVLRDLQRYFIIPHYSVEIPWLLYFCIIYIYVTFLSQLVNMRSTGMARVLSECFRKIGKGSRGADCEALTAPPEEASRCKCV